MLANGAYVWSSLCKWCSLFVSKLPISGPGGAPLDQTETERTKEKFSFHVALICSKLAPRGVHCLCVDFVWGSKHTLLTGERPKQNMQMCTSPPEKHWHTCESAFPQQRSKHTYKWCLPPPSAIGPYMQKCRSPREHNMGLPPKWIRTLMQMRIYSRANLKSNSLTQDGKDFPWTHT